MNDTLKLINANRSQISFYKNEIKKLQNHIKYSIEENEIQNCELRIGDYEYCIECLQNDIESLQRHYVKINYDIEV